MCVHTCGTCVCVCVCVCVCICINNTEVTNKINYLYLSFSFTIFLPFHFKGRVLIAPRQCDSGVNYMCVRLNIIGEIAASSAQLIVLLALLRKTKSTIAFDHPSLAAVD